jgi:predicted TIM-barrel fold metal-dependent hydrolase
VTAPAPDAPSPPPLIDAHHHLGPEPDYAVRLEQTARALGFDRVCLVGLPAFKWAWATNEHVRAALRRAPDFFVGFAYVDPADDPPDAADRWRDAGFRGLKLIRPRRAYDDRSYLPLYERAAGLGMPILFHCGMVTRTAADRERDVHSARMRPVTLDYVARQVPEAQLIAAHLGHPWWDEAAEACRLNPNLHVDLSGVALRLLAPGDVRRVLWWGPEDDHGHHLAGTPGGGGAWRHVVFGSDEPFDRLAGVVERYRAAMRAQAVPAAVRDGVMGGTIARLLRLT